MEIPGVSSFNYCVAYKMYILRGNDIEYQSFTR